jgi:6-phosphofructokinase 2
MKSFDIVTLTVSPALDKSAHFSGLVPEQKIRCQTPLFDAGGGGINVSKAISRLEENHTVITGGSTGEMLKKALQEESISFEAIETRGGHRKISLQLMTTNSQFRLFSVTTIQSLKKIKSFQLFKN